MLTYMAIQEHYHWHITLGVVEGIPTSLIQRALAIKIQSI